MFLQQIPVFIDMLLKLVLLNLLGSRTNEYTEILTKSNYPKHANMW